MDGQAATGRRLGLGVACLLGLGAAPLSAQLATTSARALDMGGGAAASVRAFGAVATNPAGLAMPGAPTFSLAVLAVRAENGVGPISWSDIGAVGNELLSDGVKEDWLSAVGAAGGQTGPFGFQATWVALSAGRVGFQVSTMGSVGMDLSPGLVELMLYGNAGRTGSASDVRVAPSSASGWAVTTAGVGSGFGFSAGNGHGAAGATVKYSVGHGAMAMDGPGGVAAASPLAFSLDMPVVYTKGDQVGFAGAGVGLDLGFQYASDGLAVGGTIRNLFNTFAWDHQKTAYRAAAADIRDGGFDTDLAPGALSGAPAHLRGQWDDMRFGPELALATAYELVPDLTLSAELRNHFGEGMRFGPKFFAGAGAEYRGVSRLRLRAGGGAATGGFQLGGGLTLSVDPVHLSLGAGLRRDGEVDAAVGMVGVSYGAH